MPAVYILFVCVRLFNRFAHPGDSASNRAARVLISGSPPIISFSAACLRSGTRSRLLTRLAQPPSDPHRPTVADPHRGRPTPWPTHTAVDPHRVTTNTARCYALYRNTVCYNSSRPCMGLSPRPYAGACEMHAPLRCAHEPARPRKEKAAVCMQRRYIAARHPLLENKRLTKIVWHVCWRWFARFTDPEASAGHGRKTNPPIIPPRLYPVDILCVHT